MNKNFKFICNISYYVLNKIISEQFEIIQGKKKVMIQAYQGEIGEKIQTITKNNFREVEENIVKMDEITKLPDWIVINPGGEKYLVNDSNFRRKYEEIKEKPGFYKSRKKSVWFLQINENISFVTLRGSLMNIKKGGYLVISNLNDIYGIQKEEFEETYEIIETFKRI